MPPLEYYDRFQAAVYWKNAGVDEHGQPVTEQPVPLTVRWVEKAGEGVDPSGKTISIDGQIVTDIPIEIDSIFWQGEIDDLDEDATDLKLVRVKTVNNVPDEKARNFRYECGFQRFRGSVPNTIP